jgi:chromosome condensin MukBEF complex kleisin-like MukF subunit
MNSPTRNVDRLSVKSVVQSVLDDQRSVELMPRDLAMLILMRHELDGNDETTLAIPYASIQALHSQLDVLELKEEQGAERRLNETLARLAKADCIAKADMTRIGVAINTEYQITPIGDALAEWHVQQSEFSGEPLTAIFRSFISQLGTIADDAAATDTADDWHFDVVQPMQYALKGMLVNIQRHQKELDRQAIEQCESQLAQVIKTIDDLQEVVFSSTNTAHALIDRIADLARPQSPKGVEANCDDLSRRLQSIAQWTTQRAIDWVEHHNVVHHLLRTSVRIDRQRRITDALKRAIAMEPGWSLEVADEPYFIRIRDEAIRPGKTRRAPRLSKDHAAERQFEEIDPDNLPDLLLRHLKAALASGEARASSLIGKAAAEARTRGDLVHHFPWLIEVMAQAGHVDDLREWTAATDGIDIQELRIIP